MQWVCRERFGFTMPSMPIDVSKLMGALNVIGQQRDAKVRVQLVFDPTASNALVDKVIDAFVGVAPNLKVTDAVLGEKLPVISKDADLVIVVGGDSLLLGDVVDASETLGIPAVVVIERGKTYFAEDKAAAQAYADLTLRENETTTAAGSAHVPSVGRGVDLDNLIDMNPDDTAKSFERLGTWIVQNVPEKRLALARALPFLRHPLAVELAKQTTIQNAAIGVVFFVPGADMPLIALNQAKMVLQIAAVYGKPMNKERLGEIFAVMAGSFGCRAVARQVIARVPLLGWAVKPAVAAGGTMAMAIAAIEYYEEDGKLHGLSEVADKAMTKASPLIDKGAGVVGNVVSGATAHA